MRDAILLELTIDGAAFATYVDGAGTRPTSVPRPFLHPVRTPSGTVVTDAHPPDHDWHLGAGVALQDVGGWNLWGGRTYVADAGYKWRKDHGRIVHMGWTARSEDLANEDLLWQDSTGKPLLHERRELSWGASKGVWWLGVGFSLTPAGIDPVRLGSPGSLGRVGAGYGGLFWRLPSAAGVDVRTPGASGERECHGRCAPWIAWSASAPSGDYTLVAVAGDRGSAADPWFVRVNGYPGIGSALAWDAPVIAAPDAPDAPVSRRFTIFVGDGRLTDAEVGLLTGPHYEDEGRSESPGSAPR